jgi:hypothetical protein
VSPLIATGARGRVRERELNVMAEEGTSKIDKWSLRRFIGFLMSLEEKARKGERRKIGKLDTHTHTRNPSPFIFDTIFPLQSLSLSLSIYGL